MPKDYLTIEELLLFTCLDKTNVAEIKGALEIIPQILSKGANVDEIVNFIEIDQLKLDLDNSYNPRINLAIANYLNKVVNLSQTLKRFIDNNQRDELEMEIADPDNNEIILPAIKITQKGSSVLSKAQEYAQHDKGMFARMVMGKIIEIDHDLEIDPGEFTRSNLIDSDAVVRSAPAADPEIREVGERSPLLSRSTSTANYKGTR